MLLNSSKTDIEMKNVYQLSVELAQDTEQVRLAQRLTLDNSRPLMGLKGSKGLFGSAEWWNNVREGEIPQKKVSGIITRTYVSGQDLEKVDNTFDMVLPDGSVHTESIFVHDIKDNDLYRVGHFVQIVYALDELKAQPASRGNTNYSEIVLEVAVSKLPSALL